MAIRKMSKKEKEFGIGEEQIDLDSIIVEDSDEEQFAAFAQNVDGVFIDSNSFDYSEKPLSELEKEFEEEKENK